MPPTTGRRETCSSYNFESLFQAALAKYSKRTGHDLVNHPLTAVLNRCDTPNSILAIFEEQARAFDEFRKGDPKLIKWLRPLVDGLHTICNMETLCMAADLVSPVSVIYAFLSVYLNMYFSFKVFPPARAILWGIGVLLSVCILRALSCQLSVTSGSTRRLSM